MWKALNKMKNDKCISIVRIIYEMKMYYLFTNNILP